MALFTKLRAARLGNGFLSSASVALLLVYPVGLLCQEVLAFSCLTSAGPSSSLQGACTTRTGGSSLPAYGRA
jgi:hypothetical protein